MTRTGSLTFSLVALLATLFGWTGIEQNQAAAQNARADSGWEAQRTSDHEPSFRRADDSGDAWRPTRSSSRAT